MATKKQAPVKAGKAATKPAVKKTVKPVVNAPKKVGKSVAVTKPALKPVLKKATAPVKKAVKAELKKIVPAKKAGPVKAIAKPEVKKSLPAKKTSVPQNVNSKGAVKAPVKAGKPAPQIMAKKEEVKKVAVKPAPAKETLAKPVTDIKAKDIKVPAPKAIAIPKISTKTVRKYQPDFTKSVLDKSAAEPQGPSLRYSDSELGEFKELIQRKLEAAKKELSYLHGLITRKDEMGGDEGDNRYMTMEDGSLSMEREQLSQMASRQITFIDHLEKAVMRIENKTYGICRVTGKLIDKARLRAVPHATLSIEAKMGTIK